MIDPANDGELSIEVAAAAAALLVELRQGWTGSATDLKDEGDRQAHELIVARLSDARPADGLLSEEGDDGEDRLGENRVWIVDPLDGTREYGDGRDDWAVHIALTIGGEPSIGAVALAGPDQIYSTEHPATPPAADPNQGPRILVSRSRPPTWAPELADRLGGKLVPLGSAGAKAMAVVRGDAEIYAHTGGQYEWDNCAPAAVVKAAGLWATRLDGSPLRYNNANPYLPDLLMCRPEWAARTISHAGALITTDQ